MKIRVQLFSRLRDTVGNEYVDLEVKDGAKVNDLLEKFYAQSFPRFRPGNKVFWSGQESSSSIAIIS